MRRGSGVRMTAVAAMAMLAVSGCHGSSRGSDSNQPMNPFNTDLAFLRSHADVVVLADPAGQARVAVSPKYQGRVMTSTTGGDAAPSFGWIGRAAVESGEKQPHMNVFGGEDRFWLGPEGGQFALYFKPGDPFDLDHWQTPEPFDWGAWPMVAQSRTTATFTKSMALTNHSGTKFWLDVSRTVRLLGAGDVAGRLNVTVPAGVRMVAFESRNLVTNTGQVWTPDGGLISIWILGQFTPTPSTTIAIPFVQDTERSESNGPALSEQSESKGPIVNDAYFGKVPPDRLQIKDGVIRFRGDGLYRSKIGLSPRRATGVAGSYDAATHVLTIVQFARPEGVLDYVNSMWEIQKEPYRGDALNSYNDGPIAPGKPGLGPFYELETSSPGLALGPAERYSHVHRTFHFVGPDPELDRLARAVLKVGLDDIQNGLRPARAPKTNKK